VNEKNIFYHLIIGFGLLVCGISAGCRSQPNVAGSTIIQSAEDLGRLKEQNRQFTELADGLITGIESIEDRINNIQSGIKSAQSDALGAEQDIDRAIQLFIEYKSRVDRFLDDYRKLQNKTEIGR
jgi:septal ring factor EnvC (AmiA/AmiB activator)